MAVILITNDLGIVAQTAKRIILIYKDKIVKEAEVHRLFGEPLHPYTQGLLGSHLSSPFTGQGVQVQS